MTMIPGTWEARARSAAAPPTIAQTPALPPQRTAAAPTPPEARRELPRWLHAVIFAAVLLAVTWIAMSFDVAAR